MTPEERQALEDERSDLQRKLIKRQDQPGFAENVKGIRARLAEIDELLA